MARTGRPESDLKLCEVMHWFSDHEKLMAVCPKFMAAKHTAMSPSAAYPQKIRTWTWNCKALRQVCSGGEDSAFALICDMLDSYVQQVQKLISRRRYYKRSLRQFLKKALIGHMLDIYNQQFQEFNFRMRLTKRRLRRFLKKAAFSASMSAAAGCADAISDGRLEQPANVISSIVVCFPTYEIECMETARDLEAFEITGWFSDAHKKSTVYKKFIAAVYAARSPLAPGALKMWAGTCKTMRQLMDKNAAAGDSAFALVCDMLDSYVQKFESRRRFYNRRLGQFLEKALMVHMLERHVHQFQKFNFRRRLNKRRLRRFLKKAASSASASASADGADAIYDGRVETEPEDVNFLESRYLLRIPEGLVAIPCIDGDGIACRCIDVIARPLPTGLEEA